LAVGSQNILANATRFIIYNSAAEEIILLLCGSWMGPERVRPNQSQQDIANLHAPDWDWASWGEDKKD